MRIRRGLAVVFGIAAFGVGLAACGDDSGDSGGSRTRSSAGQRTSRSAATRPAPTTCPPTTSSTTSTRTWSSSRPARPSRFRRPPSRATSPTTSPSSARCGPTASSPTARPWTPRTSSSRSSATSTSPIPNGASSLLANMKSIEAPDKNTVVFNLKEPDATWPSVLATASFAIVPSDTFPADKLQDDASVIGSGRYTVEQYEPGQQTVLQANAEYKGEDPAQTNTAIIQYFDKASALKLAVESGDVDIAYRSLSPTDLDGPGGRRGRQRRPGRGRGDPLPQLQPRPAAGRRRRAEAGDPPGRGADDRPPVDRRQRLQRHGQAAVLDDPGQPPVPHRRVQGRVRRGPGRRRRQEDARRRRRQDPGAARGLVDPVALRALLRRRVRRDQAPARRIRALRRDPEVDRVEPVLGGRVHRQVPAPTSWAGSRTTRIPTTTSATSCPRPAS